MFSVGSDAMVIMILSLLFASLFVNDSTIPFVIPMKSNTVLSVFHNFLVQCKSNRQ